MEAIQITSPMTVHSTSPDSEREAIEGTAGSSYEVQAGSWLVIHTDGSQSFMDDDHFADIYEQVVEKRGPGRPPKSLADVTSLAAPKRRKRRRHRAKVKNGEKKAA